MKLLGKLYRIILQLLCIPVFLSGFFARETGEAYGVGFWKKLALVLRMAWNNSRIVSGSSFIEHLLMAATLLRLPPSLEGVVVECGAYKGVSAANMSLVCALVRRRLDVFDSFEGLPEPSDQDKAHTLIGSKEIHTYQKGWWCGTFEEVKENVRRYGNADVCRFHKGFFDQTLPSYREKCVQVWLDVDYRSSLETCLKYLWPLLRDGCYLYTHESQHREIAALFYSEAWWRENLQTEPPGLVGAGTGVGLKILTDSYFTSSLGFTLKNPSKVAFKSFPQVGGLKLGLGAAARLTTPGKMFEGKEDPVSSAAKARQR